MNDIIDCIFGWYEGHDINSAALRDELTRTLTTLLTVVKAVDESGVENMTSNVSRAMLNLDATYPGWREWR